MNWFASLFSSRKNPGSSKLNIEALCASDDLNASVIELDNAIGELCAYGEHLERLSASQRIFYLNQELERGVNTDGFAGYLSGSAGQLAQETVASLTAIGAKATAAIVQEALNLFPSKTLPEDQEKRGELVEGFAGQLEALDEKFMAYEDDLNSLAMAFVRSHVADFS